MTLDDIIPAPASPRAAPSPHRRTVLGGLGCAAGPLCRLVIRGGSAVIRRDLLRATAQRGRAG